MKRCSSLIWLMRRTWNQRPFFVYTFLSKLHGLRFCYKILKDMRLPLPFSLPSHHLRQILRRWNGVHQIHRCVSMSLHWTFRQRLLWIRSLHRRTFRGIKKIIRAIRTTPPLSLICTSIGRTFDSSSFDETCFSQLINKRILGGNQSRCFILRSHVCVSLSVPHLWWFVAHEEIALRPMRFCHRGDKNSCPVSRHIHKCQYLPKTIAHAQKAMSCYLSYCFKIATHLPHFISGCEQCPVYAVAFPRAHQIQQQGVFPVWTAMPMHFYIAPAGYAPSEHKHSDKHTHLPPLASAIDVAHCPPCSSHCPSLISSKHRAFHTHTPQFFCCEGDQQSTGMLIQATDSRWLARRHLSCKARFHFLNDFSGLTGPSFCIFFPKRWGDA